jgi:hypothetical protein
MESTDIIIKPRFKRTKQEILALISQWQQSGQSKRVFCSEYQLNYYTFITWIHPKKKKKKKIRSSSGKTSGFIPLQVQKDNRTVFAEAKLHNGNSVLVYEFVPAVYLRSLLM